MAYEVFHAIVYDGAARNLGEYRAFELWEIKYSNPESDALEEAWVNEQAMKRVGPLFPNVRNRHRLDQPAPA